MDAVRLVALYLLVGVHVSDVGWASSAAIVFVTLVATLVYFTNTVWWKCGAALAERFKCYKKPGDMRRIIEERAEVLRKYVRDFNKEVKGSFYVVLGPKASGKTSVIEQAFAGWQGVCCVGVSLYPESVDNIHKNLAERFEFLKDTNCDTACTEACRKRVDKMDDYCRRWKRHPLVVIIDLQGWEVSSEQANVLADKMLHFAGEYTHTCPIIIETSVPMIGDRLVSGSASKCKALHVPPMSLSEFKAAALEWIAKDKDSWKKLEVTKACTTPEEALEKLKACMGHTKKKGKEKKGKGKVEVNNLLEEYYFKVGPDVWGLSGLIAEKVIESEHADLKHRLKSLTADEKQLVQKLLAAGPMGYLPQGDDHASTKTLLARTTSETLARMIKERITLHYVGHVYALLMMQENNDDNKVRRLMRQYGWVGMTRPVRVSSARH